MYIGIILPLGSGGGITVLKSMTGFGRAEKSVDGFNVKINLKGGDSSWCFQV